MNKNVFLSSLRDALHGLPQDDIDKTIDYYSEMIDDAVEEGEDEQAVIERLGSIQDIAGKIINDTPLSRLVKENIRGHKLTAAEIILIIITSPIWFSILVSLLSVIVSVYVSLWVAVFSLWAVFASLAVSGPVCLVAAVLLIGIKPLKALFVFGAALICIGLAVFMFYISLLFTKLLIRFTVFIIRKIKNIVIKKGGGEDEGK